MARRLIVLGMAAELVSGCATPLRGEHNVAEHEALATQEEEEAIALSRSGNADTPARGEGRWTSRTQPTATDLRRADELRRMAAQHRANAQLLRQAERQACIGIPDQDRDRSPFDNREDIDRVEPLTAISLSSKTGTTSRMLGSTIVFRAAKGMTAEWLQRLIDCHVARNAAMGWSLPEMNLSPLAVRGATATVSSTGRGFAVAVRADHPEAAMEIARRAATLARH